MLRPLILYVHRTRDQIMYIMLGIIFKWLSTELTLFYSVFYMSTNPMKRPKPVMSPVRSDWKHHYKHFTNICHLECSFQSHFQTFLDSSKVAAGLKQGRNMYQFILKPQPLSILFKMHIWWAPFQYLLFHGLYALSCYVIFALITFLDSLSLTCIFCAVRTNQQLNLTCK